MLLRPTPLVVRFLAAIALFCASDARAADLYHGLTLVDPVAETVTPDAYLLVEDGRIKKLGSGAPPADLAASQRHDMTGLFAHPGLIDTHAHVTLGPVSVEIVDGAPKIAVNPDDTITRRNGRMLLAHGITTIRNPGGEAGLNVDYSRRERAGDLVGPEAFNAGKVIHNAPFEGLTDVATGAAEVRAAVRRQVEAGVDYIKLYTGLSRDEVAAGIEAAHELGVKAVAHLEAVSWAEAARLGLDALVHIMPTSPDLLPSDARTAYQASARPGAFTFFEWYEVVDLDGPEIENMIRALVEHEVTLDATVVAFQRAYWGDDKTVIERNLELAHPLLVENWQTSFRFDLGWQPADYARAKAIWPKVLRLLKMMHDAGVKLTIGTDLGNPFVPPGASIYEEMAFHVEAGISEWAVLRMATSVAAKTLGIDDRTGRLAEGMEADVIFLKADPSRDIADIGTVEQVLEDGALFRSSELKAETD